MWSWIARITVPVFGDSNSATPQVAGHGVGPGPVAIPRDDPGVGSNESSWWSPIVSLGPAIPAGGIGPDTTGSAIDAMLASDPAPVQAATTDALAYGVDTTSWQPYPHDGLAVIEGNLSQLKPL